MAVYYKFKSAKDFDSIAIDGHFISVANLKEKIFESKHLGRGLDFDLVVTNAQTNEEYLDEAVLIPNNISVLVRRVPGGPRKPIVSQPSEPKIGRKTEDDQLGNRNFTAAKSSVLKDLETSEWDDEFGHDLCATIPEVTLVQSSNPVRDVFPSNKADEDCKIKALIETPVLDWQCQATNGFGSGRGHGRGGRAMSARGFGHFIQQCPTNGDPIFGLKKLKLPTGIPKSMLMATPDGSYALPSGDVAVLRPNEAVFEKEIGGLPSTRSEGDFPPELHCSLCKEVMNDAVLTSKCCLKSFCDKCIRDHFILKSVCVCGAVDVLADDLLPNKTLRDTINHILESNNNSNADNTRSALQIQDLKSARCPQPMIPSSIHSAASKGEQMPPTYMEETPKPNESVAEKQQPVSPSQQDRQPQSLDKKDIANIADASEATHESASAREPASPGSVPPVVEELRQRTDTATDLQWRANQEFPVDNFMTPMGPSAHNPYGFGMQRGIDSFLAPYCGGPPGGMPYNMGFNGGMPYNMEFGLGPMDMPLGGAMLPHDPFDESQGFMFPSMAPPHRHLADMNMGSLGMNMSTNVSMNNRPPLMSREEFEAQKDNLRRKRENERRVESRERSKARDHGRKVSSDVEDPSMKAKTKPVSRSPSVDSNEYYEKDRVRDRERVRSRDRDDGHLRHRRSSSYRSVRKSPDSSRKFVIPNSLVLSPKENLSTSNLAKMTTTMIGTGTTSACTVTYVTGLNIR